MLGPGNWQNIDALRDWRLPVDENIAVSVHLYEPHAFTHQGAEWLGADALSFGRDWGTGEDRAQVREHIARATEWGARRRFAMHLGEFGCAIARCRLQQRARCGRARCVRRARPARHGLVCGISQERFRFGIASAAGSFRRCATRCSHNASRTQLPAKAGVRSGKRGLIIEHLSPRSARRLVWAMMWVMSSARVQRGRVAGGIEIVFG